MHYTSYVLMIWRNYNFLASVVYLKKFNVKPVFHGACFEADSAPILSAPYTRQARPYPARIRRVQNRRRIRFKTRSMENGLNGPPLNGSFFAILMKDSALKFEVHKKCIQHS